LDIVIKEIEKDNKPLSKQVKLDIANVLDDDDEFVVHSVERKV
jgi:hypothetical protein